MFDYYPWTQVDDDIYNNLITGGYRNGAFDQIKYELYLYTRYQKNISMTCIPVFYLEPNSRITINDPVTNTYGDLGNVYGKQWRDFNGSGVDQISELIDNLKNNPAPTKKP